MKGLYAIILGLAFCSQTLEAEPVDTVRVYSLNELVVTSSAKETNDLRRLPSAVSIISPQMVSERRIESLNDLSSLVPNLYIPDYGAKLTSAIYIRGIGARSSGQSIGLYVDNVPYLDKSTFDFELTDIQRIEVLRGPQGTLYGRNAMGGIVNIHTLSPFEYQGGRASVTAGNYGTYKGKASYYVKAGEKLGISVGGYYNRQDGFFTNIFSGKKADGEETFGGNIKLDWRINSRFRAAYTLSSEKTSQGGFPYGFYNSETGAIDDVNMSDTSTYARKTLTNSLLLEYLTPYFSLTSTTGYQHFDDDMKMDQDFSPRRVFTLNQLQRQNSISEEIAIKSRSRSNYQWSFGLYGFHNDAYTDGPVTFREDGVKDILQKVFDDLKAANPKMPLIQVMDERVFIPGNFHTPTWGVALFHQSTCNNLFVDGLSLTAGLRLDYEKQQMDYKSTAMMNLGMSMNPAMPPMAIPGLKPTSMDASVSQSFLQLLPKASVKYAFDSETFAYAAVSKGYKAGGYNVQMSADLMQTQMQYELMKQFAPAMAVEPEPIDKVTAYKPEESWNYELGLRSELVKQSLWGELTVFYMDVRNMQLTKFVSSGNGRILTNAGRASSYGLEATLRSILSESFTADINYGYTHATFMDYQLERKEGGQVISTDCKGKYIPYIPHHTASLGLQYSKNLRRLWADRFIASAQLGGTGKIYWTEQNDIEQPFHVQLNAKIGAVKGPFRLDLWGRNITDSRYSAFYFESFGKPFIQKGKPLQFGVDLSVTF
ncbi:MAG: TonB-dependent receptor [Tannerellaceae bacterium]|jgi:outer membrane receptor protein involved in Fe transport|nr:TonB-dependent receptor [Tannerellaceae bacterium]